MMGKQDQDIATGAVIGRRESWRGPVLSVAVTLTEREWDEVTCAYAERWQDAEDDLDVRPLTREECIALFLGDEVERWLQRSSPDCLDDDLDDDVPF